MVRIYNYLEILKTLGEDAGPGVSDTNALLLAYQKWGEACVDHLRGMFAFAIWDPSKQKLFCARDRFGIKPFNYRVGEDGSFTFASEIKAILPFLRQPQIDETALQDYFTFQFCLDGRTLFREINELRPAHCLAIDSSGMRIRRYWEEQYEVDWHHTEQWFEDEITNRLQESTRLHLRSDVPVGAYVSGGIDSTGIAGLACHLGHNIVQGFNGRFTTARNLTRAPLHEKRQRRRAMS